MEGAGATPRWGTISHQGTEPVQVKIKDSLTGIEKKRLLGGLRERRGILVNMDESYVGETGVYLLRLRVRQTGNE